MHYNIDYDVFIYMWLTLCAKCGWHMVTIKFKGDLIRCLCCNVYKLCAKNVQLEIGANESTYTEKNTYIAPLSVKVCGWDLPEEKNRHHFCFVLSHLVQLSCPRKIMVIFNQYLWKLRIGPMSESKEMATPYCSGSTLKHIRYDP